MAIANLELVLLEDCYYLRCGDEHSEAEVYGDPLDWTARDGRRYVAFVVEKPRTDDVESGLDEWVYQVSGVPEVEIVEGEDDEEEEAGAVEVEEDEEAPVE